MKLATATANADTKGCDKPCCGKKAAVEAKAAAAPTALPAANVAEATPCAGAKADAQGCAKKSATVAAVQPAKPQTGKDAAAKEPAAEAAPSSGANR